MNTLAEIVKPLTGNKRQFVLLKVSGVDSNVAMTMVGVNRGTYNSWFKNDTFNAIYKQVPDLIMEHRDEAIQLLRRSNQLEAVVLEGKMIRKIAEELETGDLKFTRTHVAREVYNKLMSDLDKNPILNVKELTWDQKIYGILNTQDQLKEGTVDGEFKEVGVIEAEHQEGNNVPSSEQANDETEETTQETDRS